MPEVTTGELAGQNVPLVPDTPALAGRAHQLAERWGLPYAEHSSAEYQLCLTPERLELRSYSDDAPGPVYVDFVGGALGHRRKFGGGRGQPIAKAAGLKGGANPSVVDATAGLGRDGFVLAALGCKVTLVERSAVVAALLEDGLERAQEDTETAAIVAQGLRLRHADALAFLETLTEDERPDVVYLDPMFPHRPKSALVKKEMQVLQALLGTDQDEAALLAAALGCAKQRVVVKRPAYAGPLAERKPTLSFTSKKNRFDVYVLKAMGAA